MAEISTSARWPWITALGAVLIVAVGVVCIVTGRPTKKAALDVQPLGRSAAYSVTHSA